MMLLGIELCFLIFIINKYFCCCTKIRTSKCLDNFEIVTVFLTYLGPYQRLFISNNESKAFVYRSVRSCWPLTSLKTIT